MSRLNRISASFAAFFLVAVIAADVAWARPDWQRRGKDSSALSVDEDLGTAPGAAPPGSPSERAPAKSIEEEYGLDPAVGSSWPGDLKVTLNDCLRLALTRNKRLKAAGAGIEAARGRHVEASAAFWPVMEYKYRMAPVPTDVDNAFSAFFDGQLTFFNSIHIGIGVPITTFGQLLIAKRLAQGGVEAAKIRRAQTESEVVFHVKQIYYGVQFAKEMIDLLHDAIGKIDRKIKSEEKKKAWGEDDEDSADGDSNGIESNGLPGIDPYDMAKLKMFNLELEKRLEDARNNLELAYDGLRLQLDLEPGTKVRLKHLALKPVPARLDMEDEFVDLGMTHQPNAKLLDIGVESKRRLYNLEKRKLLPRAGFGFFVDVGRTTGEIQGLLLTDDFNDPFNFTRAGLGLEVKGTIDFHGAYGRIKRARAEYHKAAFERMIARRALSVESRKEYLDAKRAQGNVRRAKKAKSLANQMMFLSKVNMDIGLGDNGKYVDSLKAVLLSRGLYCKSVFNYNISLAGLEKKVGRERFRAVVPEAEIRFDPIGNPEDAGEFITLDDYAGEEGDTYGRETEDGGTTMGLEVPE